MSTIEETSPTTQAAREADTAGPHATGSPRTPTPRRRRALAALGIVGVAAIGGGAFLHGHGSSGLPKAGDPSSLNPSAPIALPTSVIGLKPLNAKRDPTQTPSWKQHSAVAGSGVTIVGRTFGTGASGARTVRIVVGRTDLTGRLEQAWAAPGAGQKVGDVTCTNNTVIVKNTQPRIRPTVMLCWRTSAALSAYSLIIDPKAKTPVTTADGAAALDAAWKAAVEQG